MFIAALSLTDDHLLNSEKIYKKKKKIVKRDSEKIRIKNNISNTKLHTLHMHWQHDTWLRFFIMGDNNNKCRGIVLSFFFFKF